MFSVLLVRSVFKFLHSKSLVLVTTAVFSYFFRLKVLGIHELKRRFTGL